VLERFVPLCVCVCVFPGYSGNQILQSVPYVSLPNIKLPFQCNICHNKQHKFYILMEATTKFTSHLSWAMAFCVRKTTIPCS